MQAEQTMQEKSELFCLELQDTHEKFTFLGLNQSLV